MPENPYLAAAARHATPIVPAAAGFPLIRSTANLGWREEWRRGRSTWPCNGGNGHRPGCTSLKQHLSRDATIFILWMQKEDGAEFGGQVRYEKAMPHLEVRGNDRQYGDAGGHRDVARKLASDLDDERQDIVIRVLFRVREGIVEMPTDLAVELMGKGREGVRPLRGQEWQQRGGSYAPDKSIWKEE